MNTRICLLLLTLVFLIPAYHGVAAETSKPNEQRVRDYVAAFNKHDIDTMMSMVSDDVQWVSVSGDKIAVESQGKAKLREGLAGYFKAAPTVKSKLEWVKATASRVAALERAEWQGRSGPVSQASLSVYEFRDGLIVRVYYYPAEK